MVQASVAHNSKTSRQESQSCLSGPAPMTCVFAHRTATLGEASPRKAAATRSKLGFALLLAGAVFTMGAKWTETPIEDAKSIAGTWKGTYIYSGVTTASVTLMIKPNGAYEGQDDNGFFKGTLQIKEGKILYQSADQRTFTLTLQQREKKRSLKGSDENGELTVSLKPTKQKRAKKSRSKKRKVSLEEAKKITASIIALDYKPPARTINDIIATIGPEQTVPGDCEPDPAFREPMLPGSLDLSRSIARRWVSDDFMKTAVQEFFKGNYAVSIKFAEAAVGIAPMRFNRQMDEYMVEGKRGAFEWAYDSPDGVKRGREKGNAYFIMARYYALAGNFDAAKRALRKGRRYSRAKGIYRLSDLMRDWYKSHELIGKASVAQAAGHSKLAESFYRTVIDEYRMLPEHMTFPTLASDLADVLADQGRLAEAEAEARKALLDGFGYTLESTYFLLRLAGILSAQGRYKDAETLTRRAINIYQVKCAPLASINLALARQRLAEALVGQARWADALAEFEAIEKTVQPVDSETFDRLFGPNVEWALALVESGRAAEAVNRLHLVIAKLKERFGANHYTTAEAQAIRGIALWRTGEKKRALQAMRQALPTLLAYYQDAKSESRELTSQDRRFLRILEAYIGLLIEIRDTPLDARIQKDSVAQAFELADVARGQSVQQALSSSRARAATGNTRLADLARREQDAQRQIGALNDRVAYQTSLSKDQQDPKIISDLQRRIADLRAARDALIDEITRRFPKYAGLIRPKLATVESMRALLRPNEALISTYTVDDRTYVWAIPHKGKVAFAVVPLGQKGLQARVNELREALDPQAETLGDIPAFDVKTAYALYASLLKPVESGWKDAEHLLIVPHGPLGQLPLAVLPTAPATSGKDKRALFSQYKRIPWLARTHAVTVLPSVSSLITLRSLPPLKTIRRPFAGFGDPYFSQAQQAQAETVQLAQLTSGNLTVRGLPLTRRSIPTTRSVSSADLAKLPRLPDTAEEVKSIARALHADLTKDVFIGEQASETQVKTMDLSNRRVIAFATHGLVPGDLDGLTQPALALSSPKVTGGSEDGLLTMGEILGLKLNADWIVLSACNTAAAEGKGAEAVSGLGRAFFYAGARALLVSNWPVETTSAKALTTDLFKRQAKDPALTRAEALQQAMLALIDGPGRTDAQGKTLFSYAHPIFWAPFSLVGDGG